MTDSIVEEAERYLKLLQSGDVIVSEQGAHSPVKITVGTTEKGKTRTGDFTEQYGTWLLEMRTYYESMRDLHSISTVTARSEAARTFVRAYRHGETYRLLEVGETNRLKAENEKITAKLTLRERDLNEKEAEVGRLENRVRLLEETLTKNGISLGGMQSDVT